MDAKLIEKLDRQRYWAVVVQAVALMDIFVETTWWYVINWNSDTPSFNIGGIIGLPLLVVAAVWFTTIRSRIVRNKELKAALYNEMYIVYEHRSQRIALWVLMCAMVVGMFTGQYTLRVPGFVFCEVGFFLGLAVLKVSWLIYNRR